LAIALFSKKRISTIVPTEDGLINTTFLVIWQMNSLRQNQEKPSIDDKNSGRKKLQVAFSTVSEEVLGKGV